MTAHAPKALTVLRQLLPPDIRELCVTAIGSSREDQQLLEHTVRSIISKKNKWASKEEICKQIENLSKELQQLEANCASIDRKLRELKEADTYTHRLNKYYEGTAAQIARLVERDRQHYDWFPELSNCESSFPLQEREIYFLAEIHSRLTNKHLQEIELEIGQFSLPDPEQFNKTIKNLFTAEREASIVENDINVNKLRLFKRYSEDLLQRMQNFIDQLEINVAQTKRIPLNVIESILKDLLAGQTDRWLRYLEKMAEKLQSMNILYNKINSCQIYISPNIDRVRLLADSLERLAHFKKSRWHGWWILAPRIIRQTRYIEKFCRVDGLPARSPVLLEKIVAYLKLEQSIIDFKHIWPIQINLPNHDPRVAARVASEMACELNQLFKLVKLNGGHILEKLSIDEKLSLAEKGGRKRIAQLIDVELKIRVVEKYRVLLTEWQDSILNIIPHEKMHPCMFKLVEAINERNSSKWREAWEKREQLKVEKTHYQEYLKILEKIGKISPDLKRTIKANQGDPNWKKNILNFEKAWSWACARSWLQRRSIQTTYNELLEERQRLQRKIKKRIEKLASLKAWNSFFERLDEKTEQSLIAWTKTIARIGKGKGKYAHRHRKAARKYLMECLPRIPAWIMPIHKVWETVEPLPGSFDVIIVDEASQAGVESLALMLLGNRIVVVGDDKQNTPEAIGIYEDDIARLIHKYLRLFRFRDLFRPDTSLYDHAERAFGNLISLREHFRCVPEIIRFSNELCYSDAPLIPLRQPPPNRIDPLKTKFIENGVCNGNGSRVHNQVEADEIVNTIANCINSPEYQGKTMGVIVLQGHLQAEIIERKLAEVLEPKVREEIKLRCGVPATFQGDQRDVIFLSMVVAPNYNFRALTRLPDLRRFNVAMSRARDQVWLFHSVRQDDLHPEDLRYKLLKFFYEPCKPLNYDPYNELLKLENEIKNMNRRQGECPDPYESWFEIDVALELLRRKYRVLPQYEVAGYRIDLVIEGVVNRLAVECDGDAWHGPERWEYDVARQRQLERAGWTFVRIRESEFYTDRARAIQKIINKCDELGIPSLS